MADLPKCDTVLKPPVEAQVRGGGKLAKVGSCRRSWSTLPLFSPSSTKITPTHQPNTTC